MNRSTIPLTSNLLTEEHTGLFTRLAKRLVHQQLGKIQNGEIVLRENHTEHYFGHVSDEFPAAVIIDVIHSGFYKDVAFAGSPGSGEAYMNGKWSCSDIVTLVRIFLRNRKVLDNLDNGFMRLQAPAQKIMHWLNRNTRTGSRKNISAHYDIGNELFRLFLDDTMMYSSAYYENSGTDLAQAAVAKLDLVCNKLQLSANDHLLEIGTGWGGLAIHAARHYGCKVTTTTISDAQYAYAEARIKELGLTHLITLLKQDYRDLTGEFDKVVSIEMIEAVGYEFLPSFFKQCNDRLKPGGKVLIQAITIADQRFESYKSNVDFIQKYIFPGGFLPSINILSQHITEHSELVMEGLHDIGLDYAKTLNDWRKNFIASWSDLKPHGYDETFKRLWLYYFAYCEGAFLERSTSTVHLVARK